MPHARAQYVSPVTRQHRPTNKGAVIRTHTTNCTGGHIAYRGRMGVIADLPYFSEVILMAATCEHCGYRTTEVKSGGVIAEKGRRIELKITDPEDLSRDVLKVPGCAAVHCERTEQRHDHC